MQPQKRTTPSGKTRWGARYRDTTGKERSKSFTTQREAKEYLQEVERAVRRGTWVSPEDQAATVGQLVDDYIALATKPGTRRDREILRDNLGPLADMQACAVRQSHVEAWAVQLRDGRPWADGKPLAPATVKVKAGQLRTVLQRATDDGLLERNPEVALKRFDAGRGQDFYVPADAEVRALYAAARKYTGAPWFPLALRLGVEAGLRAGEVCGLRVMDVDFMRRVLHIRVQTSPGKPGGEVVPLKSRTSVRDVPISEDLALALSRALEGRAINPEDLILEGAWGRALYSSRVSHVMADVRRAAKVDERIHFHSMRHLFASRLLAAGVDLPTVSGLLGHASVAVTARVYAHQIPGRMEVARDAVARARDFSGFWPCRGRGVGVAMSRLEPV